jgi:hypothetical protein
MRPDLIDLSKHDHPGITDEILRRVENGVRQYEKCYLGRGDMTREEAKRNAELCGRQLLQSELKYAQRAAAKAAAEAARIALDQTQPLPPPPAPAAFSVDGNVIRPQAWTR